MSISHMLNLALTSAPNPDIGVVVITGISIVFFVLIILFIVISIQGVLFKSLGKDNKQQEPIQEKQVSPQPISAKAPVVQSGIPNEVVAAISAAIACMEGSQKLTVKSISRASVRKNAWSTAAAAYYTEPF